MAYKSKSSQKFLAGALSAAVVTSVVAPGVAAAAGFSDVQQSDYYYEAVMALSSKGIINGVGDGKFAPQDPVKREAFAKILAGVMNYDVDNVKDPEFSDVKAGEWYYKYVAALKEYGITNGIGDGKFGVGQNLSRGQAAKFIVQAFDLKPVEGKDVPFKDIKGSVYEDAIKTLYTNGYINGISETQFAPDASISRGALATMIYRVDQGETITKDTEAPKIELVGDATVTVENGATYTDAGVKVTDNVDKDLQANVEIKDEKGTVVEKIDTTKAGKYTITYTAKDAAGNEADAVVRTVVVKEAGLVVSSVSAINSNYVTVKFAVAPKEDMLGQTIEVKNGAGVVVPVKPLDIAAGDTTADFEFATPVKTTDLTGVWTVAGVSYDLDLLNNLKAFLNASDQLALNKALTTLGIKNVDVANMPAYHTAKGEITKSAEELTLADVQKLVDDVNAKSISAEEEKAIVKAVLDAKTSGNQVALLQALQNKAFVKVNPDWVTTPTNGYMAKIAGTEATIKDIQGVIDGANTTLITTELTKLQTAGNYTEVDKDKLTAAKALVTKYAPVNDKGEIINPGIKAAPKAIDIQLAVADVTTATTPTALKAKLTALATLVNDTSIIDMKNYVDVNGKAYLAELAKPATVKNTAGALNTVLTSVNTTEATKLVDAVKAAANETPVDADKLLKALNDLGLKKVAASNKADYAANIGFKTVADKDATQTLVNTVNVDALSNATDADSLLTALKVLELDNIVDANKAEYFTNKANFTTDEATVKAAVKTINDQVIEDAAVKAINDATTATEVKSALDKLAITSYVNVPSTDKLYIAEQVLGARDGIANKKFADKAAVTSALDTATTGIIAKYTALIGEFKLSALTDTATTVTQLSKLGYSAFDNLTAGQKADVAEAFVAKYPKDDKGVAVDYKTLTQVRTAVDAAIAATK